MPKLKLRDRYVVEDGIPIIRQINRTTGAPIPTEREKQAAIDRYHASRMIIDQSWASQMIEVEFEPEDLDVKLDVWDHSRNLWPI